MRIAKSPKQELSDRSRFYWQLRQGGASTVRECIQKEFLLVEELLGRRVSRMDLFTYMEDEIYELCLNYQAINIFKNYLSFLNDMGLLTADEQ